MERIEGATWKILPQWWRYVVIGLLVLGILFRFYHLDRKLYWLDETHTSLRVLGYTKTEVVDTLFTGKVITAADLQQFQRPDPDRGWDDTVTALQGNAEHSPLYFLMARQWVNWFGYSIATMRSLPALISLLIFPSLFWLCQELFTAPAVAWLAIALVAIAPLQVLYAQEARPYSLGVVMTLLSSAVLLWARRTKTQVSWFTYAITIATGLYTQLLFILVAIAHAIYIAVIENFRPNKTLFSYTLATSLGVLAFMPWLQILLRDWQQVQTITISLKEYLAPIRLIERWGLNLSQGLLGQPLDYASLIPIALAGYAFYYLYRRTSRSVWLLPFAIAGVGFFGLAVPDLIAGGQRSIRIRYLLPSFICLQIALAYLFATQAIWVKTGQQKFWRVVLIMLITVNVIACSISSQAIVWWNKQPSRCGYYPIAAQVINASHNPLVISNGPAVDLVAFSYWLQPRIALQLVSDPARFQVAPGFNTILLFNSNRRLRQALIDQGYELTLVEKELGSEDLDMPLWSVRRA
ncbi:glycosyltransferase family 39 protein [Pantanalinema rosaneae CENA516]|uniref:glycosyltransferase family 39 protein n=1 Tax=Pantanalinema rosaneae TaxID=1620701 RepID=UPI003D701292